MQASKSDVALGMADGLDDKAENELKFLQREATLKGSIPTAIVNTGASSFCMKPATEQPTESECGRFQWKGPSFKTTVQKSNKIFQMVLGHVAQARNIVHVNLPI